MATQFAGGTYVNTTITSDGTINTLITAMQTQLTNAGWTVSSGSGTNNVLMKSAALPAVSASVISCGMREAAST